VDLVEGTAESGAIELPWHLQGTTTVLSAGTWVKAEVDGLDAERFVPAAPGPIAIASEQDGKSIRLHLFGEATLYRTTGPGLPGSTEPRVFFIRRTRGATWLGAIIDLDPAADGKAEWGAGGVSMVRAGGRVHLAISPTRVSITHPGGKVTLAGLRDTRELPAPLIAKVASRQNAGP